MYIPYKAGIACISLSAGKCLALLIYLSFHETGSYLFYKIQRFNYQPIHFKDNLAYREIVLKGARFYSPLYLEILKKNKAHTLLTHIDPERNILFVGKGDLVGLGECGCDESLRSKIPEVRETFETRTVLALKEKAARASELKITCFCSGYLYGEFILLAKFFDELHCMRWCGKIEINIIDSKYSNPGDGIEKALTTFSRELSRHLPLSSMLTIRVFSSARDFQHFTALKPERLTDCLIEIEAGGAETDSELLWTHTLSSLGIYARFAKICPQNKSFSMIKLHKRKTIYKDGHIYLFEKIQKTIFDKNTVASNETFIEENLKKEFPLYPQDPLFDEIDKFIESTSIDKLDEQERLPSFCSST
jgi:hypothetical protein